MGQKTIGPATNNNAEYLHNLLIVFEAKKDTFKWKTIQSLSCLDITQLNAMWLQRTLSSTQESDDIHIRNMDKTTLSIIDTFSNSFATYPLMKLCDWLLEGYKNVKIFPNALSLFQTNWYLVVIGVHRHYTVSYVSF